ncbi:phosphotransferase [Nocardia sp. NPDC058176]|uniref:phosphotransferase n=1 Tax=Nocardia sp. NPDC058176 TaxID=3346368 RepID=UPI0036DED023
MTGNTAVRPDWLDVPEPVRAAIEHRLGTTVRSARTPQGGFTSGLAARLLLGDGRRVFVKAIEATEPLAASYRSEAAAVAGLPAATPSPALLFAGAFAGWVALVFEDVPGRHPRFDRPDEWAAVSATVDQLGRLPISDLSLTPFAECFGPALAYWTVFAEHGPPPGLSRWACSRLDILADYETRWLAAAEGTALVHTDLRPDNMIRAADGTVLVVDWASPCRGARWIDLACLVPSLLVAGVDPGPILAEHPATIDVDRAVIVGFLVALAGYWEHNCRLPAPNRSPHLRRHQARSAHVLQQWLRADGLTTPTR